MDTSSYIILGYSAYASRAIVKNNLTYFSGGTPIINGTCSGCINANPIFINAELNNAQLSLSSPAIDAGEQLVLEQVLSTFESLYPGQSIRYDAANFSRPQGAGWDIGAYEFVESSDTIFPSSPSGLSVL